MSDNKQLQQDIYVFADEINELVQRLIRLGDHSGLSGEHGLQADLYEVALELNEIKDQQFKLGDRAGALDMVLLCPKVSEPVEPVKTITNDQVVNITSNQATLTFDISPVVDVAVEINDGSGYQSLSNTGVFASHNYNIHNQTTLQPSTSYTIRLTPVDGSEPCLVSFTTAQAASSIALEPTEFTDGANLSNMSLKANGDTLVTIDPNGNYGVDPKFYIGGDEAWISYCIQIQPNWTPTSNVKLPGFAALSTGGPGTGIGGQGGGGAGGALSWSARMIVQRPGTAFTSGGLGYEIYHDASTGAPFGEAMWWGNALDETSPKPEASIADGQWHCITQHIKLNTIGQNDGLIEGFLDGTLLFQRTDLGFTDNPAYHDVAFWFNIYHGGSADTSGTSHDICFKNMNYNTGPVNETVCNC